MYNGAVYHPPDANVLILHDIQVDENIQWDRSHQQLERSTVLIRKFRNQYP